MKVGRECNEGQYISKLCSRVCTFKFDMPLTLTSPVGARTKEKNKFAKKTAVPTTFRYAVELRGSADRAETHHH